MVIILKLQQSDVIMHVPHFVDNQSGRTHPNPKGACTHNTADDNIESCRACKAVPASAEAWGTVQANCTNVMFFSVICTVFVKYDGKI